MEELKNKFPPKFRIGTDSPLTEPLPVQTYERTHNFNVHEEAKLSGYTPTGFVQEGGGYVPRGSRPTSAASLGSRRTVPREVQAEGADDVAGVLEGVNGLIASPVRIPGERPSSAPVFQRSIFDTGRRSVIPTPQVLASRELGYAIVARPMQWMPPPTRKISAVAQRLGDMAALGLIGGDSTLPGFQEPVRQSFLLPCSLHPDRFIPL